jgi:hypothetical protein
MGAGARRKKWVKNYFLNDKCLSRGKINFFCCVCRFARREMVGYGMEFEVRGAYTRSMAIG